MLSEGGPVASAAVRLHAFVDGYKADASLRRALPTTMAKRTEAMFELLHSSNDTGLQPWADMYTSGHGEFWRQSTEYVTQNHKAWERALSLSA